MQTVKLLGFCQRIQVLVIFDIGSLIDSSYPYTFLIHIVLEIEICLIDNLI